MSNTEWELLTIQPEMDKYLRGTHAMWCRFFDGEYIYRVEPIDHAPGKDDGGYRSIRSAIAVKGMLTR